MADHSKKSEIPESAGIVASRRDTLFGIGGLSIAAAAAPASARRNSARSLPVSETEAYLALRFNRNGQTGWWINRATVFAMALGRRAVPLFDVIGLGRDSYAPMPDGGYHLKFDECGWYCIPGTMQPVDRMTSPINGRTIKVQHYRSPNETVLRDGKIVLTRQMPEGVEIDLVRGPLLADSGQVWMSDDLFVRSPRKVAPEVLSANPAATWNVQTSLATYNARRADLLAFRDHWVPATCAYQTMASWRPWFDADEVPGVMSWRMHGTKVASAAEIPEPLLRLVRAQHPDLLKA